MTDFFMALKKRLESHMGHTFNDAGLLTRAITHRSFSSDHNERLEFLGDSILGLVVADMLYARLRDLPEGDLSRIRANLVRQETLHQLALEMGIPEVLKLGEGEHKSGGNKRPSILADALEAIIGAIYLDAGYDAAKKLVLSLFKEVDVNPQMQAIAKDAKTALQEWLQGKKMPLPIYRVIHTSGAAHQQTFEVECEIADLKLSERGLGASRRAGEQAAAASMMQRISKH